ncbi:histidine--tRNA ligase [Chromatiales bacterium (ex Bugula neritina AB1)]|nr:histidine--tRNA ligase [Chromatiales bacterium (ex Bugula neritina AB1)]
MGQVVKSIKGVRDLLPDSIHNWHFLEKNVREVMDSYGYSEMRTPILEKSELFHRSIGEVTDIVEKEMYSFEDRNGDKLSLRPENTASCVRAAIQHGLLNNNQVSRIWYLGPMFRRENPQRGRYRQFWQVGAEVYGLPGPYIESELILLGERLWRNLGLAGHVTLQVNSLGTAEDRVTYKKALVEYLNDHLNELDEESKRRLGTNPLRILDTKNPRMSNVVAEAPDMLDYLCEESKEHFEGLQASLTQCNVAFEINTRLVRGLDYYSHTVFEWVTDHLGSQGTVCAGGRYDGLTEQLGAKPTPGVGWALGMDRLVELAAEINAERISPEPEVYMVLGDQQAIVSGLVLAEQIRSEQPQWTVISTCTVSGLKSQFKKADRSNAKVALILAESEIAAETVGVKSLRQKAEQLTVPRDQVIEVLRKLIG